MDDIKTLSLISTRLMKLGLQPHRRGFQIMKTAIFLVVNNSQYITNGLTKTLYPTIAKQFNISQDTVAHRLSSLRLDVDPDLFKKEFGKATMSPGELIALIAEETRDQLAS